MIFSFNGKNLSIINNTSVVYIVEFMDNDKLIYSVFVNSHQTVSIPDEVYNCNPVIKYINLSINQNNIMKKYKLLKDLPNLKAGSIFESSAGGYACGNTCYLKENVEDNPVWFEPINEWPKTFEELQIDIEVKFILPAESKQLDSIIAFTKLTHIAKAINGNWIPNWNDGITSKYVILRSKNELKIDCWKETFFHISFHSREAAEFSLEYHRELWEQYYMM